MANTLSALIQADHREFRRMFSELRLPATRPLIAPMLMALLGAHARSEEAHVYPALRERAGAPDAVEHSQEEHVEADRLAAQLAETALDDPKFDDLLEKLVDSVSHHLEEEEETVLPKLDKLSDDEQHSIAEAF
ncbi:MAG TPA: hemerythrin domain-containing protein, partial [Actinomycetes bacterium]|nr:hemerythrin domain-containing protein [Actinomycetes bacterium]